MRRIALKIGLLVPRQGPAGIWAPSCEANAILAAAEINATGGILGREIEVIFADAGPTDLTARQAAADLAEVDEVEAVVAMLTSSARVHVSRVLRSHNLPFVYTPQFEGHARDPGVLTIGETASQMLGPGFAWLCENKRANRFFFIGNNYKWPIESMAVARRAILDLRACIVGDVIIPWEMESYDGLLAQIVAARPHVVATWLLGHETIAFNRAFAKAGLASRILRFNMAMEETILYAIGAECSENLFATAAYFSNLRSANNDGFLERYHTCFGATPPPVNSFGQSLYEGFYCLAGLAEAGGSLRTADLRRKMGRARQQRTARGFNRDNAAGAARPVYLVAAEGTEFQLIQTY